MTNQNFCPYCAAVVLSDASQCQNCGAKLESVIDHELPKQTILFNGRFEILHTIGRGGFGIAYLAQEVKTSQQVVVKELFPDQLVIRIANRNVAAIRGAELEFQQSLKHSEREATIASQLKHPSAPKIIETWRENGTSYTAMEYIRGQTLEQRLLEKTLSEPEVIDCMTQILEVLQELHGKGLLHRDIKPANIILGTSRVELIDYGSVTTFRKGERIKLTTRLVTPEYAPLEQFASETELSPATDLYALGATMFEAMTGKPPPAALERANGAKLPSIQGFSGGTAWLLTGLIEKMLEMKVANRPKSASSVLEMLKSLEHSVSRVQAQSVTLPSKSLVARAPAKRRSLWDWAALVGVIYALELFLFQTTIRFQTAINQMQYNPSQENAKYNLSNPKPQPNKITPTGILSDIRVYLVPLWVQNEVKPNMMILINLFDSSNIPFDNSNTFDNSSFSYEIIDEYSRILAVSGISKNLKRWQIDMTKKQFKSGKYTIKAILNENNANYRKEIYKDVNLKLDFINLKPIQNIYGSYNSKSNNYEFVWDLPPKSSTSIFDIRSSQFRSRSTFFPTSQFRGLRYDIEASSLRSENVIDFYTTNVVDLFLLNPKDGSQIAFSRTSVCASDLYKLKESPYTLLPLKTGCY
jgi:serine/threonine protein kinase